MVMGEGKLTDTEILDLAAQEFADFQLKAKSTNFQPIYSKEDILEHFNLKEKLEPGYKQKRIAMWCENQNKKTIKKALGIAE